MSTSQLSIDRVRTILENIKSSRIAVIGDLMVDSYIWGDVVRVSPEAPVPVVEVHSESDSLGGAANVANNIHALGATAIPIGVIGDDMAGQTLIQLARDSGFETAGIFTDASRPTITKSRVIAHNQHVVRVDRENKNDVAAKMQDSIIAFLEEQIASLQAIVLEDYNKGLLSAPLIERIITLARKHNVIVTVDPKFINFLAYRNVTLFKPNRKETAEALARPLVSESDYISAARTLREQMQVENVLITLGSQGMLLLDSAGKHTTIPTVARRVHDVSGAGDTVIGTLTAALAAGCRPLEAAELANCAAGAVVAEIGAVPITPKSLLRAVHDLVEEENASYVLSLAKFEAVRETLRIEKKSLVFTNGVFDILHRGHVEYLQEAKKLGDVLVVAVNSDASVRRLKGEKRPIMPCDDRMYLLSMLKPVDYVIPFEEDTPAAVIEQLVPDVLVKGADYRIQEIVGHETVLAAGGRVERITLTPNRSTTDVITDILQRYGVKE